MSASYFLAILPELITTIGAILLLMVAAFAGDRVSELVNAIGGVILTLAFIALLRTPASDSLIFSGLLRIDAFAFANTPLCNTLRLKRRIMFSFASFSSLRVTCTISLIIVTDMKNIINSHQLI